MEVMLLIEVVNIRNVKIYSLSIPKETKRPVYAPQLSFSHILNNYKKKQTISQEFSPLVID